MASRDNKRPMTFWIDRELDDAFRAAVAQRVGPRLHEINRKDMAVLDTLRALIEDFVAGRGTVPK